MGREEGEERGERRRKESRSEYIITQNWPTLKINPCTE